jgi:hypothetical protein
VRRRKGVADERQSLAGIAGISAAGAAALEAPPRVAPLLELRAHRCDQQPDGRERGRQREHEEHALPRDKRDRRKRPCVCHQEGGSDLRRTGTSRSFL